MPWPDASAVVHLCFEWYSGVSDRMYWSTVCLAYDTLKTKADGIAHDAPPTCVRCIAGAMRA